LSSSVTRYSPGDVLLSLILSLIYPGLHIELSTWVHPWSSFRDNVINPLLQEDSYCYGLIIYLKEESYKSICNKLVCPFGIVWL